MKLIVALSILAVVAADVSHLGATDYSSEYTPPVPQLQYGAPSQQSFEHSSSSSGGQLSQEYGAPPAPIQEYLPPVPQYSAPVEHYSAPAPQFSAPAPHYHAPAPQYSAPAPAPHYHAPAPQYSAPAPAPHYHAPAPQYSAHIQHISQPEPEYLPPQAPQFSAPAPHYSVPAPQYSAPSSQYLAPVESGQSYESHDDGYHYKTVKRIKYRHRA